MWAKVKLVAACLVGAAVVGVIGTPLTVKSFAQEKKVESGRHEADPTPQKEPFDLLFKYGVGGKNILNTFKGTYTRDMVVDPSVTTKLILGIIHSKEEYKKMPPPRGGYM